MAETVPPPDEAERTAEVGTDVFSPELALVDPALRDRLSRQQPPVREPEHAHAPTPEPAPRTTTSAPVVVPARAPLQQPVPAAPRRRRRRRVWPLLVAALLGGAVAVAAIVGLDGLRNSSTKTIDTPPVTTAIGRPASSPSTTTPAGTATVEQPITHTATTTRKPATTATATTTQRTTTRPSAGRTTTAHSPPATPTTTPARKPPPTAATTPQQFAWAPVRGATAYDVALFDKTTRVFHARTTKPTITIAVRTGRAGPAGSVAPGAYEWYVWPVVDGHQASVAIVRSRLRLSR